jgi:hypothetical protein
VHHRGLCDPRVAEQHFAGVCVDLVATFTAARAQVLPSAAAVFDSARMIVSRSRKSSRCSVATSRCAAALGPPRPHRHQRSRVESRSTLAAAAKGIRCATPLARRTIAQECGRVNADCAHERAFQNQAGELVHPQDTLVELGFDLIWRRARNAKVFPLRRFVAARRTAPVRDGQAPFVGWASSSFPAATEHLTQFSVGTDLKGGSLRSAATRSMSKRAKRSSIGNACVPSRRCNATASLHVWNAASRSPLQAR